MTDNMDMELRINDHEHEIKSLKHRMEKVEEDSKALNSLATSVAVMVEKQDGIEAKVDAVDAKVSAIEAKPAKRWEGVVDKVLYAVIGAVVAWLLGGGHL